MCILGIIGRQAWVVERELLWKLRKQGVSLEQIALQVGISPSAARAWVVENGGVGPRPARPPSGRFLTLEDREIIAVRWAAGVSKAAIAHEVGKHPSSIGRELKRNSDRSYVGHVRRDYLPMRAHRRAKQRSARPKPAKLRSDVNAELHAYVQAQLLLRWSPEQIVQRLVLEFPDRLEMR